MAENHDYEREINRLFELQKKNVVRLRTSSIDERIAKLKKLKEYIWENKEKIQEAVYNDLRKPPEEVLLTEIYPVVSEIRHVIKNLKNGQSLRKSEHPYHFLGQKAITDLRQKGWC